MGACPDDEVLGRLVSDTLPPAVRAQVAEHAASCSGCHALIAALIGATDVAGGDAARAPRPVEARLPTEIGRYQLERPIGSGGMGVVWAARDPALGRRVAVKILRAGVGAERLQREAMAMARLAHPNVVAVHDVGIDDGRTYIAMALIDGVNLREWLRTPRAPAAILDALLQAGRGVIAAHEAGLIHRDLKPDNVFVAADGAVLVGDFGLAREDDSDIGDAATDRDGGAIERAPTDRGAVAGKRAPSDRGGTGPPGAAPLATLTVAGSIVGTPAYMAPEQAGGEATAASDQFSFCVTAWEALFGERPFEGSSVDELRAAIGRGAIAAPPDGRGVPARIERALRRGLAVDPAARFPSMRTLLAAMTPRRRRWPIALAAAAVAIAIALGSAAAMRAPAPPSPCAGTERLLQQTWSPWRRAALAVALAGAGGAPARIAITAARVDRYAADWIALRHGACEATHVRREQPPAHLAAVARCLDRQAATLGTALDAVLDRDANPVQASMMLEQLDPIDRCRDPADGAPVAPEAEALRTELAALDLRQRAIGRLLTATDVPALRRRATALADDPALIAVEMLEGRSALDRARIADAEQALRDAVHLADAGGHNLARARAAALLAEVLVRSGRRDEALLQLGAAGDALARIGGDAAVAIEVAEVQALAADAGPDRAAAIAANLAVVDQLRRQHGDDSIQLMWAYLRLSTAYSNAGQTAAGIEALRRSRAIQASSYAAALTGPAALTAAAIADGRDALQAGDFATAVRYLGQAAAIARTEGAGTAAGVGVVSLYANTQEIAGDAAGAARTYAEAVAADDAVPAEERDPRDRVDALVGAGRCQLSLGHAAEALPWFEQAVAAAAAIGPAADKSGTSARAGLGRTLVALRRHREARPLLERALAEAEREQPPRPHARGLISAALARTLWETGGTLDRARARSLAADAEAQLQAGIEALAPVPMRAGLVEELRRHLADLQAWRRAHPEPPR